MSPENTLAEVPRNNARTTGTGVPSVIEILRVSVPAAEPQPSDWVVATLRGILSSGHGQIDAGYCIDQCSGGFKPALGKQDDIIRLFF